MCLRRYTDNGLIVSTISRAIVTVTDIIALMVALKKAVGTVREASRYRVRVPLSDVLIRDGEPYFIL